MYLKWAIRILLFTLVAYSCIRIANLFMYTDRVYHSLSTGEKILCLLHGIRFDVSIVLSIYGLPILIGLLPLSRVSGWSVFQLGILYFCVALFFAQLFFLVGDLFYFQQVKRHMFDELLAVTGEIPFILDTLFGSYLFYLICFLACVFLLAVYFFKKMRRDRGMPAKEKWWFPIIFLVGSALLIRGGFGLKPIGIVDAYVIGGSSGGQLTLNGIFTAWHASRNSTQMEYPKMQKGHFENFLRKIEIEGNGSKLPFVQSFDPAFQESQGERKLNVVILLLESWSNFYVESFGKKQFHVTPNFDDIAAKGMKFENFLATGSRSIEAIQAILTSFPSLKGLPTLGLGFELMNTAEMGALASEQGYSSVFMQAAKRQSFRLDSVASAYGFTHYYGMEDYPALGENDRPPAFGWDRDMLMHSLNVFDHLKDPFVSFVFTGTTHTPFRKFENHKYADKSEPENEFGFLNTLNYSDAALGEFFTKAKEKKWFDDTVFILTADHTFGAYRNFDFLESFAVPLVIYSPKYIKPAVVKRWSSHIDILPTLLHILGTKRPVALSGRSLLKDYNYDYAYLSQRYANPAWVDGNGYIVSNMESVLEHKVQGQCTEACRMNMHDDLKNLSAYLFDSIRNNSWMPDHLNESTD